MTLSALYGILADVVVLGHFAFIVFVLFGGLLALRWRWMPWIHIPAMVWGMAVEIFGWICPLTPLENLLLRAGDSGGYSGGFLEYYLIPIIYPTGLTRDLQIFLGIGLLAVNFVIYLVVWRRRRNPDLRE
ncbi:MAG: DUF2784 domain-containing protein [Gammaproteobacteria bacterium]|nr:DUF2784 domain-containing protein [Gammaproteobacteria bacterium]